MPDAPPTTSEDTPPTTPNPAAPGETSGAEPPWRQLHPATILIELVRRIMGLGIVLVGALLARVLGGGEDSWADLVIGGVALFGAVGALLRYLSVRFRVEQERLVIWSGIVTRQSRTIPLERIQNIDLQRGVLHRMLHVVDLNIQTAGGTEPEAALSVLAESTAAELRRELLRQREELTGEGAGGETPAAAEGGTLIWQASLRDLVLAGASENRVGWFFGALSGLAYMAGNALTNLFDSLEEWLKREDAPGTTWLIGIIALGILVLIVLGWLLSIGYSVVRFYDFTLRGEAERLKRRFGLLTQHEHVIPLRRIQILKLDAPWLRRLIGYVSIHAETAGSVVDRAGGGTTPLCPMIKLRNAQEVCGAVFGDLDLAAIDWQRVSRLTIRRGLFRYLLTAAALLAAVWYSVRDLQVLYAAPVIVAGAVWLAYRRYEALGYARQGRFLLARAGVFRRRTWIVPEGKIQSLHCTSSPFQRRLGLANLQVATAGSQTLSGAELVDLPLPVAQRLQDELSVATHAEGLWLVDGV